MIRWLSANFTSAQGHFWPIFLLFSHIWPGITDRCTCINTRSVLFAEKPACKQWDDNNNTREFFFLKRNSFCCSNEIKIIWSCANTVPLTNRCTNTISQDTHFNKHNTDMHECKCSLYTRTQTERRKPHKITESYIKHCFFSLFHFVSSVIYFRPWLWF